MAEDETFNIPNPLPFSEVDTPPLTQQQVQEIVDNSLGASISPSQAGEVEYFDHTPNVSYDIFDPRGENDGVEGDDPLGWQALRVGGQDSLSVSAQPAKAFFPNAAGQIIGVMPSLQDTGVALDNNTRPTYTLPSSGDYIQYLAYDGTAETCRIYFELAATDITTSLIADESYIAIGTLTVSSGNITSYSLDISGPEAIGGGGGDACTALKASISQAMDTSYYVTITTGFIDSFIPTIGGVSLESSPQLTVTAGQTVYLVVTGDLDVTNYSGGWYINNVDITNPRFEAHNSDPSTPATLDYSTGAVTQGTYAVAWTSVTGTNTLTNSRCGHHQTFSCPGSTTVKIFQS